MKLNAKLFSPAHVVAGVLLVVAVGVAVAQTPATANAAASGAANGGSVVAKLGTITLGTAEVQRLYKDLPDGDRAAVQSNRTAAENWLRGRLTAEALLREARSKGWADKPEIKARVADAMREITARIVNTAYLESVSQIPADYPSEAETKAAYDQAKGNFNLPAIYHVAQIFVKAPSNDKAAVTAGREKAKKLAKQAKQGDFAAIARANSEDPKSAERGGDVGSLPLASLLPEMQDTVAKMKKDQVSEPMQAASGFHIVKVLDIQPPRAATYGEVKQRLQALLRQQRQQQAAQTYLASLAPAGSITIDNAALDAALAKAN
jgi:parvulin-like peptidyl-prolyl isomerase